MDIHPELKARFRRLQMLFASQMFQVPLYGQRGATPSLKLPENLSHWLEGEQKEAELFDDVLENG